MPRTKAKNIPKENSDQEYEVECIVSHRIVRKREGQPFLQYLIKWKNFPSEDNTWEPTTAVVNAEILVNDYWKNHDKPEERERVEREMQEYHRLKRRKLITVFSGFRNAETELKAAEAKKEKRRLEDEKDKESFKYYESDSEIDFSDSELEDEYFRIDSDWSNISKVEEVKNESTDGKKYVAITRWSDGKLAKYPTSLLQKRAPLKLIEYYEKRLMFENSKS